MEIDIHDLQKLDEILISLRQITTLLCDALDENTLLKIQLYKAISECKISNKLSMESKLIELIAQGKEELVNKYIQSEQEVAKLKYHQRYAVEALNAKKHQNNIMPKG